MPALDWVRVPVDNLPNRGVTRRLNIWRRLNVEQGRVITARNDDGHLLYEAHDPVTLSTEFPDILTQYTAATRGGSTGQPWYPATVDQALSVPAIFRAVAVHATVIGSLSMKTYRKQVEMEPDDRPSLVKRPDPNTTPRDFYRDTGWNLARYGEAWWYVPKRDGDGLAQALYNVPDPREVEVEQDRDDPVRPHITWRNRSTKDGTLKREDIRQLTYLTDGLRGIGPLQVCKAATSVSVKAQDWAANFYAVGGYPSILIKSATPLGGGEDGWSDEDQTDADIVSEADRLKAKWIATAPNTPMVIDPGVESVQQFEVSMAAAQALEARYAQNGEAARMFGVPGVLLEYVQSGSSLTYQNIEQVFTQWVRLTLRPSFLEPIEQAMSDLLTRSTVARFNTEQLEMPDLKTRYEVYASGIASGIITAEYAQAKEGLLPGDVENAPVPFSAPIVVPRVASTEMRDVRCPKCQRLVARAAGPIEGWCRHCKAPVAA